MAYVLRPTRPAKALLPLVAAQVALGPASARQLQKKLRLSFGEITKTLSLLLAEDVKREPSTRLYKTEWAQVGDGRGQPSQEAVYMLRPKKED